MSTPHLDLARHFISAEPEAAATRLQSENPLLIAGLLETIEIQSAANIVRLMQPVFAAPVLAHINDEHIKKICNKLKLSEISPIVRVMNSRQQNKFLKHLSIARQSACKTLVSFPDNTLGAWIEADVLVLEKDMSVDEALKAVKLGDYSSSQHIFVVDAKRRVIGKVSVFELLRSEAEQFVGSIMNPKASLISGYIDLENALDSEVWKRADTVAVVNNKQCLIGVVHHHRIRSIVLKSRTTQIKNESPMLEILSCYGAASTELIDYFL